MKVWRLTYLIKVFEQQKQPPTHIRVSQSDIFFHFINLLFHIKIRKRREVEEEEETFLL